MNAADFKAVTKQLLNRISRGLSSDRKKIKADIGQGIFRIILVSMFLGYYLIISIYDPGSTAVSITVAMFVAGYLVFSLLLFAWTVIDRSAVLSRRVICIVGDYSIVTLTLYLGGELALPALFLYPWIAIGNWLRYGASYSIISGVVGLSYFMLLSIVSPFWVSNPVLTLTVFFTFLASTLSGYFKVRSKYYDHKDTEHEQAAIRVVIASLYLVYFYIAWHSADLIGREIITKAAVALAISVILSIVIFSIVLLKLGRPYVRRIFGTVVDLAAPTYVLIVAGELASPMVILYLWVPMGNGFRYGVGYIKASTALSVLGFMCVFLINDFWSEHILISASLLVLIIALPLYMSVLIKKLNLAIDAATEANTAKTQFLANMSHELRTPLNGVIGISDLLLDEDLNHEQHDLARKIQSSAHLLLGIIESILDISKIEARKVILEKRVFDLYGVLRQIATVFETQAKAKGLSFRANILPEVPSLVVGDEVRLKQVLSNLLGNAIKFTDRGLVSIKVKLVEEADGVALVCIQVQDTGIGIPEDRKPVIFEPFTQADSSVTRKYGGTGLGMSIAKQLVESMSGKIDFESTEGVGSCFSITVPFDCVDTEDSAEVLESFNRVQVMSLIDLSHASSWITHLSNWGLQTFFAKNIDELLGKASGHNISRPLVVIVETSVLNIAYDEFVDRLKQQASFKKISIIALLGEGSDYKSEELFEYGFDNVLRMPVQKKALFNAIHVALVDYDSSENVISLSDYYRQRSVRRLKILVAEDNKINQLVIEQILSKAGHQVFLVSDGEQALDQLQNSVFDMLVVDVNMPKVSGLDVIKAYRFMDTSFRVPVIILTADATPETQKACKDAGADLYITKPLDARKLLDSVAKLSARNRKEEAIAPEPPRKSKLVNEEVIGNLKKLAAGPGFLQELVDVFGREGRRKIEVVKSSFKEVDYPEFKDSVHYLKGVAGDLGADCMVALCKKAEELKPYQLGVQHEKLIQELEEVFVSTHLALKQSVKPEKAKGLEEQ